MYLDEHIAINLGVLSFSGFMANKKNKYLTSKIAQIIYWLRNRHELLSYNFRCSLSYCLGMKS